MATVRLTMVDGQLTPPVPVQETMVTFARFTELSFQLSASATVAPSAAPGPLFVKVTVWTGHRSTSGPTSSGCG